MNTIRRVLFILLLFVACSPRPCNCPQGTDREEYRRINAQVDSLEKEAYRIWRRNQLL